jgi:acylphosphatase
MGLAGWVRNTPDGSVEVEAEGNAAELQQFRRLLDDGPSGARVESVEEVAVGTAQLERPFRIKR